MLHTAFRSVRRAPGLAIAAVACLALGTAATTAVGTLVSALLVGPLPFPESDRLVRLWFAEAGGDPRVSLSIPEFEDFAAATAFDAFLGTARVRVVALLGASAERLRGEGVTRGYFATLGLRPHIGRLLTDADHAPGQSPALVLSHGAWSQYFGADPSVIGRPLRTARAVYTIVGVAQAGFHGTVEDDIVEFFIPVEHYEPATMRTNRMARSAWAVARLAPGVTPAQADAKVAAIGASLARTYPDLYGRYVARVEPLGESWRGRLRGGGGLLFAAAALLLVIGAINVGCLLLARTLDRRRECAVRAALGADHRQLSRQIAAEAALLVAIGGTLGALTGPSLLQAFLALSPVSLPHYINIAPDRWTVLLVAVTLSLCGMVAAMVPVAVGRAIQPAEVLRASGRGQVGRHHERTWTSMLIAAETALTLVLLVASGLLLRSFDRLTSAELGFNRSAIARLAVTLNAADAADTSALPSVYERLRQAISRHPGVRAVGLVSPTLPPWDGERNRVLIRGTERGVDDSGVMAGTHFADHGLLPMLGVRMVAGRNLSPADDRGATRVAVISESLAALAGGPARALGRNIQFAPDGERPSTVEYRIVGVAADVGFDGMVEQDTRRFLGAGDGSAPGAGRYDVYFSLPQTPAMVVSVGVATDGDPSALIAPIRQVIGSVVPASAVHWTSAMGDEIALEYAPSRFYTLIVAAFSASALLLTSIGLFALLSHAASSRTGEMGLRLALGATPRMTAVLLLRTGLGPLAGGVITGLAGAGIAARLIQGMLYGIEAFDAAAFLGAVMTLVLVALAAAAVPARRVAVVDPVQTLRE